MTGQDTDNDLISHYASQASETAFHALVARHAPMVHATALRQVGESALAEEITQNTFLALARKTPRIHPGGTLAGWLHRTALLESKARLRQELRRRRREETAAQLNTIQKEGDSILSPLIPLLDEALLELKDPDRQALVLRFLEGSSLREVGTALGVDEDAARKRVARALDRVCAFFRHRGFAVPAGTATISTLLSAQAAVTPPAHLAATITSSALLSAKASSTPLTLAHIKLMALTKTQVATVTLLLAAIPLSLQWRAKASLTQEQELLSGHQSQASLRLKELEEQIRRKRASFQAADFARANAELQPASPPSPPPPQPQATSTPYGWNDDSPLVRVPKALLSDIRIPSVQDRHGTVSQRIIAALQLSEQEAQQTQLLIDQFRQRQEQAHQDSMQIVDPTEKDLAGRDPGDVRVLAFKHDPKAFSTLRQELFSSLEQTLGEDRSALFRKGLTDWIPVDDSPQGLSTGMAVLPWDHRYIFHKPAPGSDKVFWNVDVNESGRLGIDAPLKSLTDWIPDYMRAPIQDWIELATPPPGSQPAAGTPTP